MFWIKGNFSKVTRQKYPLSINISEKTCDLQKFSNTPHIKEIKADFLLYTSHLSFIYIYEARFIDKSSSCITAEFSKLLIISAIEKNVKRF